MSKVQRGTKKLNFNSFQNENASFERIFRALGWKFAVYIVSFGSIFGIVTSLFGLVLSLPRVTLAMAEDGLFFNIFSKISSKFETPIWGIMISGCFTGTVAALFDVDHLIDMISIGTVSEA